jgi:hypothetical protein
VRFYWLAGIPKQKKKQAGKRIKYRLDHTPLFFYFNFLLLFLFSLKVLTKKVGAN